MDEVDTAYWSADNTADRLVDFAISLYGEGDREEHYEKMVRGMERGYEGARHEFGGTLPEIADKTIELAKDRLEDWAEDEAPEPLELVA